MKEIVRSARSEHADVARPGLTRISTATTAVDGPRSRDRAASAPLGAVGLLLAIAGLYGLVAYNVSRRTREIGIRMAIGAGPVDVLRLVMGKGLVLVGIGTAIGLAMGFAVERLMNSMLFNAGGVDIAVYLVVVPSMVAGDDAGGLCAGAKSLPDRADAGAAKRIGERPGTAWAVSPKFRARDRSGRGGRPAGGRAANDTCGPPRRSAGR